MRLFCFNLVIERLLISGLASFNSAGRRRFLFQSRYRAASHFRRSPDCATSPYISFQSRYRAASHFRFAGNWVRTLSMVGFNLVIERLLISGQAQFQTDWDTIVGVSISLSSGFSFQGSRRIRYGTGMSSFNLVIERLHISGQRAAGCRLPQR